MSRSSDSGNGGNRTMLVFFAAMVFGLGLALFSGSGIPSGTAVELQNVFCKVTNITGTTFAVCDNSNDTITIAGGNGIIVSVDGPNDKITINTTGISETDDEVNVFEAGSSVGTQRKLNFATASDFDVVDDGGNDRVDIGIADNAIGNNEIASHTSTKITITAKGQLNSAIVYNDQNNNLNSNLLTNYGTPTATTDVQRVDKLQLKSLVVGTCPDGAPLEYQSSNSTWICGTDTSGSGITSINGDTTAAQVFSGTTNQVVITDTGAGTLGWDVGTDIVQIDQTNTYTGTNTQDFVANTVKFGNNKIIIRNTASTFAYTLTGQAIGANRTLNLPLTTGTDTLATVGLSQTFTATTTLNTLNLGGDADAGANQIGNLGTPDSADDAQRADKLQIGKGLVVGTCPDGAPLEYQSSNSTWICGTDAGGAGSDILVNVFEAGSQIGSVARQLDFTNSTDFDVTEDSGSNQVDIDIADNAIRTGHIKDNSIISADIQDGTIANVDINSGAAIDWSKVSKSGSILNDIGSPTSAYSFGSQRLTSLGTPSATTDAQRVDKLQLNSLVIGTCPDGSPLEYQTSNSTWICGTDTGLTAAITSINGDATAAQVFSGVSGNILITDTGAGTLDFDVGSTIVQEDSANTYTGGGLQDFGGSAIDNVATFTSNAADPADSGVIRVGNTEQWCSESDAAGTDVCLQVDANEDWLFSTSTNSININSNTVINGDFSSTTNTFGPLEKMSNVTDTGCAVGEILKVSGTTWQCAADATGSGITSINSDTTAAQVFSGDTGDLTITDTGAGTLTFDVGSTIAQKDESNDFTTNLQKFSNSILIRDTDFSHAFTIQGNGLTANKTVIIPASTLSSTSFALQGLANDFTTFQQKFSNSILIRDSDYTHAITLNTPNISSNKTLTLPDATDTLVGKATSDTLTNKELRSADTGNTVTADPRIAILTAGGATLQAATTPARATVDGTNMDYVVLDFDTTTAETVIWNWEVPDGMDASADIVVRVRFQVASGTAGVCWDGSWLGRTAGETVDASFGSVIGACDSSTGTASVETATITFTSAQHGLAAGDSAFFKLTRDVADATDTNTNDARLIDVRVSWR